MVSHLDMELDRMEEARYRKKNSSYWKKVRKLTRFSFAELECIMLIFYKMQKRELKIYGNHLVTRSNFRDVLFNSLGMTDAFMVERMMVGLDRGTRPYVTSAVFAKAMSLFLKGTLDEKIVYAFTCYDLLNEGVLYQTTMYQLMKNCLADAFSEDSVETVKEFIFTVMQRFDIDNDGEVCFDDFRTAVRKNPELLEALGPVLPSRRTVHAFIATWNVNWPKV